MVVGRIAANFQLEVRPSLGERFVAETDNLFVAESDPADRSRVRRNALAAEMLQTRSLITAPVPEQSDRFVAPQSVADVVEVANRGDAFRLHVRQQLPQRLALGA